MKAFQWGLFAVASLSAQGSSPKHTSLKIKRLAAAANNIPQNVCDNTAYSFVLPDQKSVQVITKQWTDEHKGLQAILAESCMSRF